MKFRKLTFKCTLCLISSPELFPSSQPIPEIDNFSKKPHWMTYPTPTEANQSFTRSTEIKTSLT